MQNKKVDKNCEQAETWKIHPEVHVRLNLLAVTLGKLHNANIQL